MKRDLFSQSYDGILIKLIFVLLILAMLLFYKVLCHKSWFFADSRELGTAIPKHLHSTPLNNDTE